jgi:hypothetical protein
MVLAIVIFFALPSLDKGDFFVAGGLRTLFLLALNPTQVFPRGFLRNLRKNRPRLFFGLLSPESFTPDTDGYIVRTEYRKGDCRGARFRPLFKFFFSF